MTRTKTMVAGLLAVASLSGCNVEPMEPEAEVMPLAQSEAALVGAHRDDIVWRHSVLGENVVWRNRGTTYDFPSSIQTLADLNWKMRTTGDFNKDGKTDILWHDSSTTEVVLWVMDGTVAAQGLSLGNVDPNWVARGTGDFNGDGFIDILWRHSNGAMAIWFMNGTAYASGAQPPSVATDWKVAGVGDLNNDGRADIIWRHDSGQMVSWLMNGATPIGSGPALPSVGGVDWQPVGTGDFNGDGQTDLLWFYKPGQQAHVWLMSGGSHVVSANIGTAAGEGWEPVGTGNFSSRIFQTFQWYMNAPVSYQAPAGCTINNAAATGGFWTPASYGGVYCLNPFGGACRYVANGISADRTSIFCDFDMLYHDNYGACNFATDLACSP